MENVFSEKAKANQKGGQGGVLLSQISVKANPIDTQKELAKTANVSHDTIAKAKANQKLSEGKGIQKSEDLKKTEVVAIKEVAKTANVSHDTIAKAKANQAIQYKGEISLSQISVKVKPIDTQKELAKTASVSHDTIAKVKVIQAKATEEVKEKLSTGNPQTGVNICSQV